MARRRAIPRCSPCDRRVFSWFPENTENRRGTELLFRHLSETTGDLFHEAFGHLPDPVLITQDLKSCAFKMGPDFA